MIEDLKGKLANESDQREKAEVMFNDSNNKVQLLEQELEKVNERLTLISAKYEEASKAADESGRLHRSVLQNFDQNLLAIAMARLGEAANDKHWHTISN